MSFADFPRSAYAGGTAIVPVILKKRKKKKRKMIYWSSYHVTLEWTVHVISGFKVLGQPELKLVVKKGILLFSSS